MDYMAYSKDILACIGERLEQRKSVCVDAVYTLGRI